MSRRLAATVAALTAASLLWASPSPAAQAKNPPPPRALSSASIDTHLGYKPQSTCTPSAKPGTSALLKLLISTYGGSSSGISRHCGVGGTSEHKEGRALDWRRDVKYSSHRKSVDRALKWMTANNGEVAYRLGVMYIIWNQRIWSIYYPELGWRKMANRGSYTANHKNHVHISLSWDGAMKQTSWWTGTPITSPLNSRCGASGVRACLPTIARDSTLTWPYQDTEVPESFLPAPWKTPNIGGSPQVGRTLTAVPGTWMPDGATLTYQWTADSAPIQNATDATYVVEPATVGRTVRVKVTATSPGAPARTLTSDGMTDVVKGRFTSAPKPKILGTVATDQTVTLEAGTWAPAPDSVSYAWYRNGSAIKGATAASYTLTPSDTGRKLTVKVSAKKVGFTSTSATSSAIKVAPAVFTTRPVPLVTAEHVVGAKLTADPGTWDPAAAKFGYQWYANGKAIKKATKPTFTLTKSHLGKAVQVRVKATRPGYTTVYLKSIPTTVVAAP